MDNEEDFTRSLREAAKSQIYKKAEETTELQIRINNLPIWAWRRREKLRIKIDENRRVIDALLFAFGW